MQSSTPLGQYSVFRYIRKGLFYCVSIGTEAIIAAALLPVLTRSVTPADYGLWVLFVALFSFMRPIIGLMLQEAIRLNYYKVKDRELLELLQSAILIPSAFLFVLLGLSQLLGSYVTEFFAFPGQLFWAVLLTAYLHGIFYTFLALMQFRGSNAMFLIEQILHTLLAIVGTITLLSFEFSWLSAVYARMTALLIANIIGFIWLVKNIGNPFAVKNSSDSIYKLWKVGVQFLPVGLAGVIVPLTDRVVVAKYIGTAETSFLGIGALFSSLLWIVVSGFIFAWQPRLFQYVNSRRIEGKKEIRNFSLLYFLGLPVAAFMVILCSDFVAPYMVSYKNDEIADYILWMCLAILLQGFYQYYHTWLHATSQLKVIALLALFIIITNIVLNIVFVSNYGGIGAAWATGTSYLLAAIVASTWLMLTDKTNQYC